MEMSLDSVVR